MRRRELIVNADDFGLSRGITDGIMAAHLEGVVTSTSLMANQAASEYAIEQMLKQEPLETGSRGKIVNIASAAALIARAGNHAYGASKAAVVHLTRQLAVTYGPQRINVNAICPGLIPTALTRPTNPEIEQWHRDALQDTSWPRLGTPKTWPSACCFSFPERRSGSQELPWRWTEVRAPNKPP